MIVEQIDAFKSWLTAVLKPMCEADPGALAKYVLALIKKDKSEEELRKSMVGQLDVFLESETESFVELVFQTLVTKDYINTPVIPNANPPNPNIVKLAKEAGKDVKMIVQPSELPNLNEAMNGSSKKEWEQKRDTRKNSDAEREERLRRKSPIRHRSSSRNRSRSRSRSWERLRRSRSREKSRERMDRDRSDRDQYRLDRDKRERPRVWRNKSPPRRYDRRRGSRTPSPNRIRSRSRSPRHAHRGRYRGRLSTSRSRSRSLDKKERRDSLKDRDSPNRPGTPTQDSNHGDMDLRLTNSTQSIQNVVTSQICKKRCRDFDEKGFCMNGERCLYDHGVDPVVVEDAALTRVLSYNPDGTPSVVPPGMLPGPIIPPPGHPMMPQQIPAPHADNPYNPQAPHIWRDGRFRGPRPMVPPLGNFPPQPNMNRELIPVPVMDNKQLDVYNPMYNQSQGFMNNTGVEHENSYKKKPYDYNRHNIRAKNPQNCSLELKKVPQGMNSITHLNNHFSKFGKIVNIQVQYEGDPEAAIVTFSSHAEANAAYRSTEAVLNNRFIKVFWHNDGKQENVPPGPRSSVKDRLGVAPALVPPNMNKVLNLVQPQAQQELSSEESDAKAKNDKEESKAQATEAIKKNQELLAAQAKVKKNQDVQRKQVMKIQSDLRKKKQELLDKQLSQQKVLIEKMEKLPPGPQRDIIKETIKKTQEAIEEIKKDLESAALTAKPVPKIKTKEEAQRELLDTELDLMMKQQEGGDTSEIQKKIEKLKASYALAKGRGRVVRRYNPIVSRHLLSKNNLKPKSTLKSVNKMLPTASFQKHAIDHRPTRLLISGYETDEQESVLSHFQQYGEIADYITDSSLPSITLNYKTRKEAELAMLKGKHFQDRTLSITWSNAKHLNRQKSNSSVKTVLMSETEEEQLIDQSLLEGDEELGPEISEEALLQDDEEEEDEDRSWRR